MLRGSDSNSSFLVQTTNHRKQQERQTGRKTGQGERKAEDSERRDPALGRRGYKCSSPTLQNLTNHPLPCQLGEAVLCVYHPSVRYFISQSFSPFLFLVWCHHALPFNPDLQAPGTAQPWSTSHGPSGYLSQHPPRLRHRHELFFTPPTSRFLQGTAAQIFISHT